MQVEHKLHRLVHRRQGVTIVELLAVIAILTVLMGVVWLAVGGRVRLGAKQAQLKSDMRQVIVAVNLYRADNDNGLPSNWQHFGYYKLIKKGAYGDGYPLEDIHNPDPPFYDVSYHTPECAAPPKAGVMFIMFRQMVAQFESRRPRANTLDIDNDQAAIFQPACLANSYAERYVQIMQAGKVTTPLAKGYKSLGISLSGTLSYQYEPGWFAESAVGF